MTLTRKNSNWTIVIIASVMLAFVFAAVMAWFWDSDRDNPFKRKSAAFVIGEWYDTGAPADELDTAPAWDSPTWKSLHSDRSPKVEWEAWRRIDHPGAASTWGHRWVPAGEKLPPASDITVEYSDGRVEKLKP